MISAQRVMTAVMMLAAGVQLSAAQEKTASEKAAAQGTTGKHYVLPANAETAQWGWLDPAEKPKLVVNSGDTVAVETLPHAMGQIKPGVTIDEIAKLRLGKSRRRTAFGHRPHLRNGRGTWRHAGNPHQEDRDKGRRFQFQSSGKQFLPLVCCPLNFLRDMSNISSWT